NAIAGCCALAGSGHAAAPASSVMNLRLLIAPRDSELRQMLVQLRPSEHEIAGSEMGSNGQVALRNSCATNGTDGSRAPEPVRARQLRMSALRRQRPHDRAEAILRSVPPADSCAAAEDACAAR